MRTIRGDAAIVAACAPHDILKDLIDQRIGAFKLADPLNIVMNNKTFQGVESGGTRKAGDFDEAETVIGKPWFPNLGPLPFQGVNVSNLRAANVGEIQLAFGG